MHACMDGRTDGPCLTRTRPSRHVSDTVLYVVGNGSNDIMIRTGRYIGCSLAAISVSHHASHSTTCIQYCTSTVAKTPSISPTPRCGLCGNVFCSVAMLYM
jgi:hypothetical protein